ncbi:MAG: NAD-dependent epimerase/dehydratase family protein [Vicinamibacterales bacterium]|jgi:nucleoside-diphosphate-sugar epimerase|nr:NAD-dependent epimerase/dehydratase family protein [Vicinamibacterales bacterium]
MSSSASARHVVFGAGQIGATLARLLADRGHEVVLVSRSGRGAQPGVHAVAGDALDAAACAALARGASVVYHCMNPKYEAATWEAQLPPIQRNLVAACGAAGARLVVLDNVYALGRTAGTPMREDTPARPASRKGAIRARLADDLLAAHARGDVRAVIGRASDFFGPGGTQTMFERRFWKRVLAGKSAQVIVDPDTPHTYHFIPDVAAGLASLGTAGDSAYGSTWMLPCAPAVSTRELIGRFGRALGRDVAVSRLPAWLFAMMKPLVPIFREFDEMLYQWQEPFVVDDRRFREHFGASATALDEAARQTVDWARETFGGK